MIEQQRIAGADSRVICPICGAVSNPTDKFCAGCRSLLTPKARVVTTEEGEIWTMQRRRAAKRWFIIRITAAVVLVGALAAGTALYIRANQNFEPLDPAASNVSSLAVPGQWASDGFDPQHTRSVSASLPRPSGTPRWTYRPEAPVLAAPTIAEGVVYIAGGDGSLVALDEDTGREIWRVNDLRPLNSSPVIAGNLIYIGARTSHVYAFDKRNGQIRWQVETEQYIVSTPNVVNGEVFIGDGGGNVYGFDAITGEERWRQKLEDAVSESLSVSDGYAAILAKDLTLIDLRFGIKNLQYNLVRPPVGPPIIIDGVVHVLLRQGIILGIDLKAEEGFWDFAAKRVHKLWAQLYLWGGAPEPPDPRGSLWSKTGFGETGRGGMAISNDSIYFVSAKGKLFSVDRFTRETRWSRDLGGRGETAPTVAGDTVYVASGAALFAVDTKSGEIVTKIPLQGDPNTDVVVTQKGLYIADTSGALYAFR